MRSWTLGCLLGLTLACQNEAPADIAEEPVAWTARAETDVSEVQVGDDLVLTVTVVHPSGGEGEIVPPPAKDLEPFAVLDTEEEAVSPVETRIRYRLAAYRLPGELEIPALVLRYRDETGELQTLETEAIPIRLVTSLTPDVTDIHDIKDPVALEVPRDWSFLPWLLAAVLALVIAYLIYRRLRTRPRREETVVAPPPPTPPAEEAEAALRRLWQKGLLERGEIALFYTELTDILKRYAGRRFEVAYLERMTHEMLRDLRAVSAGDAAGRLRPLLEGADLVKFAKLRPDADDARRDFEAAGDFVRRTRPRPPLSDAEAPREKTA